MAPQPKTVPDSPLSPSSIYSMPTGLTTASSSVSQASNTMASKTSWSKLYHTLEDRIPYRRNAEIAYHWVPMTAVNITVKAIFVAVLINYIANPEFEQLPTSFYFDLESPEWTSGTHFYLEDLLAHGVERGTAHHYPDLIKREDKNTLFVMTKFTDFVEQYEPKGCGMHMHNNDHSTMDRSMSGMHWCPIARKEVLVPMSIFKSLNIRVTSRIACTEVSDHFDPDNLRLIFSNYNRNNDAETTHYRINIFDALASAWNTKPCHKATEEQLQCCDGPNATCAYAGYVTGNGVDLGMQYHWDCNVNTYSDPKKDRYRCAVERLRLDTEAISSSSIIDNERITDDASNYDPRFNGTQQLIRRRVHMIGVRVRFSGLGGCKMITLRGILSMLASALSIHAVGKLILFIMSRVFEAYFRVPDTTIDVLRREPFAKQFYVQAPGQSDDTPKVWLSRKARLRVRKKKAVMISAFKFGLRWTYLAIRARTRRLQKTGSTISCSEVDLEVGSHRTELLISDHSPKPEVKGTGGSL